MFQGVVPNGQTSECLLVKGPLFFIIFINNLSGNIISTVKLFEDGTSLFSIVHDSNTSVNELKKDLQKISEWA